MKIETIEKIFNFLEEKEGKGLPRELVKLITNPKLIKELENHPDGTQYRYKGDLDLSTTNITKLPNDLYVTGSLNLYECEQLTKLPDNLYVGDYLNISYTNITEFPDNLYVGFDLYIDGTPLAEKYTDEEIYKIVASTGGEIRGRIFIQ